MAQDVFSKMAEDPWLLNEDGYLNADTDIKEIIYHPTLNVILICTNSGIVRVLDVNSGVVLQSSYLSAINQNEVVCKYIPGLDRVLFCDGQAIGIRSDYNGVLLLDSILQKPVSDAKKEIKLELLLSEAIILKQGILSANASGIEHVINELTDVILNAQKQSKKGIKAQKWNTVCLQLPLDLLQLAASAAVSEMLSKNHHTPELGVASAVQERLCDLSGEQGNASDRRSMASEAKRRETFSHWPHMDYKWALPDQMAQAGFYHQPNASGDDRAMCFTCTVCLVCWERTDEPWSEHERHSPNCPFVMGEYTQNVPLSVTYATNPAINATYRGMNVKIIGTSSVSNYLATATSQGLISVFDIAGKIDRSYAFFVTQFDSHILEKYTQEFGIPGTWSDLDEVKYPAEKRITALSIVSEKCANNGGANPTNPSAATTINTSNSGNNGSTSCADHSIRPTIICGLNIRCRSTQKPQYQYVIDSFNDQNKNTLANSHVMDVSETSNNVLIDKSCLYLVVYDFMFSKEKEEADLQKQQQQQTEKSDMLQNATSDIVPLNSDGTQDENNKKNNFIHAEVIEHLSSLYKTLIPGESDEVFYPPPPIPTKSSQQHQQQQQQQQQHSGPRLLPIDMQLCESDSSTTEPYIINPDYVYMNGQLSSILNETFDKSISDHITEMKNSSKTNKKLNYSRAVQCISLPQQYKNRKDLDISDIITTQDGCHILVVLKNLLNDGISVLLLYELDFTQKMVKLLEEPKLVRELMNSEKPMQVTLLPLIDKFGEYNNVTITNSSEQNLSQTIITNNSGTSSSSMKNNGVVGNVVMVCADGAVRIVELSTMKTLCLAQLEGEKFVSAAYCNSLERLCASTEKGALHFYALNDTDNESSEDHDEDDLFGLTNDTTMAMNLSSTATSSSTTYQQQTSDTIDATNVASGSTTATAGLNEMLTRCFHEPPELIHLNDLKRLHSLCQFEPLKTGYCAVVPPCWSEIVQAQRQRKHPQSINKSDLDQFTRTWRLQTDTTTWDEHIIEITLPIPLALGHVDVHFTLQPSAILPRVEVTLLRQNTSGIGHKRDVKFSVDETITIDMLQQWADNPVISQEYLRAHNADILAGPVNITSSLDLSEQCGVVTLTSPKLFKSRNRTLLLHVRAVNSKDEATKNNNNINNNNGKTVKKSDCKTTTTSTAAAAAGSSSGTAAAAGLASSSASAQGLIKNEFYMGCDCIHELSVTVYISKHTEVQHEKSQRNCMLESNPFVHSLLLTAINNSSNEIVNLSLDILCWVTSIRFVRNRSNNGEIPNQQLELIYIVEYNLPGLLHQCMLMADRSIAHKCMKLIQICCNGAKNMNESSETHFEFNILKALLSLLNSVHDVKSAGGLQWIFALLLKVTSKNSQYVAAKCVTLLNKISDELNARLNPYHLLLRSRYGLYGTPLELELFDIEPPQFVKGSSIYWNYTSSVPIETQQQSHINDFFEQYSNNSKETIINPKYVLSGNDTKLKWKNLALPKIYKGLIETEPLHFVCISASEGTRLERADASTTPTINIVDIPTITTTTLQPSGLFVNKKIPANKFFKDYYMAEMQEELHDGSKDANNSGVGPIITKMDLSNAFKNEFVTVQKLVEIQQQQQQQQQQHSQQETLPPPSTWISNTSQTTQQQLAPPPPPIGTWVDNDAMFVDMIPKISTKVAIDYHPYTVLKFIESKNANSASTTTSNATTSSSSSSSKPTICWQPENLLSQQPVASSSSASSSPNSNNLSWQHLLVQPPQQVMVVERMHSGARRYVTLDFGQPILLTDVHLPASAELVSVSLDIWLKSEDADGTRLVVATDIGSKNLVLNDLQPAPLCRYVKITTVGKHGMTTARVRIPIGHFYGHVVVLPEEIPADLPAGVVLPTADVEKQLQILSKLFEDVSCRYSLACSKLKELLRPFLVADMKNLSHLATYMNIMRSKTLTTNAEHSKLFSAYQESITYQKQLNTVRNVMMRLESSLNKSTANYATKSAVNEKDLSSTSTDKLRAIAEGILEVLLTIESSTDIDYQTCTKLFKGLCISQSSRLQLLTAIFLDKSCRNKRYWGNFLADTLTDMFATSNTTRFPQDRVFILLAYLSRRSTERSAVIDAGLRVISHTLQLLENDDITLLAVSVDLPLLSWLLMYLSLQLDMTKNALQSANRWDWVFGEVVGKANADSSKMANRKKCYYKRFNKQQSVSDDLDTTQKLVQSAHVQALSALSNEAACLNTKLDAALKTQQLLMKKVKYTFKDCKKKMKEIASDPSLDKANEKKTPLYIDGTHCLIVVKGLLRLVLSMDHSSSADMLMLSFKVMGRLVSMAKIKLGQLINQDQLLNLINFCLASKIPWAPHALACLLQDVLENEIGESDGGASSSNSWQPTDDDDTFLQENVGISMKSLRSSTPLPSVYESDDSELEEFVDGILNKDGKKPATPKVNGTPSQQTTNSVAIDSRLDLNVDLTAEISLRKLLNNNTQNLLNSVNAPVTSAESEEGLAPWSVATPPLAPESTLGTMPMLNQCFDTLFHNLQFKESIYIENILELWLTLNAPYKDEKFDPSAIPQILLKDEAVRALVTALAWAPGLSLSAWFVALQTLTLVCNTNNTNGNDGTTLYWSDAHGMASCIVNHPDFMQIFLRLLSGSGVTYVDKSRAGPSLCKALSDFIDRLLMRCYVESPRSKTGKLLKYLLLKIVHQMVNPSGSIALRQGYLDIQCTILKSMIDIDYSNSDLSIALRIFEDVTVLVHSYFLNVDKIKCINIGEKNNVDTTTFNEIFACVMGSDPIKMDFQVSTDLLFLRLLKVLGKLVQTQFRQPGDNNAEAMDVEPVDSSQTDESKAEQIQQDSMRQSPTPPQQQQQQRGEIFADMILEHQPSIIRLCHSLAACKSSSLCMLANVSQKNAFPNLSEPGNVGDAVFHVLASLAKRTTDKKLMLPPLLEFFRQTPQLSEPLLWFILQVLNTEEAIRNFLTAGGIKMLAQSFVISSNTPNTISKLGTISTVMQHFSGVHTTSDASSAIVSASASRKLQQATIENKLALVNFAPACTITCASGTAQPAEILIQCTAATHRRARTPQWSYHFYPDEAYTELILQLPSAILLREVHLQPHLSALATCPSSVAIEVSANGPSRLVPVCPPLSTSGMVFIRLHLPSPEVVNCVLIRLYRPRDANNIGLSQIRLLGNLAFGGGSNHQSSQLNECGVSGSGGGSEDESHCKHSLGWLRLLHHCFTLPTDMNLTRQLIACASEVPRLLSTCCELLLVPSHVLPIYLPCLEKVLRELSLYNVENGTVTIQILLNSRSSIIEPLNFADSCWQDRLLINATGYQSACELLYQICEHQDENTLYRVVMIIEWVKLVAKIAIENGNFEGLNPAYISCIASILWTANQSNVNYDLNELITIEFFDRIYNLKLLVENNIALKYSLDSILCSMCYIQPELYPVLLQRIGVLVPNLSTDRAASISDDRKDSDGMTDDTKQETFELNCEWYGHLVMGDLSKLHLSNEQLETVALVSRSPSAIQQLLDSGLPKMLNRAIFEFCTSTSDERNEEDGETTHREDNHVIPMAKLENVTAILKFFTNVCDEKTMQDWLGSTDGSSFWLYLLHWLCKKPFVKMNNASTLQSEAHAQLEEVCVRFLSKCCLCHPSNQDRLAKVLCEVISMQTNGISGFLRRLTLQLLLEIEKIPVSIQADETLYKNIKVTQAYLPVHPAFKQTYNRALLYLSTTTSLADILEHHIYFKTSYKMETNISSKKTLASKKDIFKGWFAEDSDLSMAAGVTAKDKRAKDAKNQITATPQSKKKRYTPSENQAVSDVIGGRLIKCETFSDQALPLNLTLGQLLKLIEQKGVPADWPCVHLLVCQNKSTSSTTTQAAAASATISDKNSAGPSTSSISSSSNEVDASFYQQQQPFSSALQVFSSMGGLALLAQHLPTVYPEAVRPPPKEKLSSEQSDSDWIKIEDCEEIYEDVEEAIGSQSSPSKSSAMISNVPSHSLTAFGLFLRLPGYADILLKDMKKALCLLRLVLGVTDDEEGGDIFQSPIAETLPTVPFEVLKKLYDATPLTTDDGRLLRRISINTGVVHLLLACLGIFTHQTTQQQQQQQNDKGEKDATGGKVKEDRSQLYWAKGTGFGTGSTQQSWNVEQALLKQRSEEEHVTVLLQVFASYISPNGEGGDKLLMDDVLPATFHDLLANSSLLPALSSYLRNDSVLDMARHIPLYRAALQLLRALASSSQLVDLLLPQKNRMSEPSIMSLLKNMKTCVDTYASKLRINTKINTKFKTKLREQLEELEQGEGLATLMPDIQETANLVAQVTSGLIDSDQASDGDGSMERMMFTSNEEKYLKIMKNLQFGSYEMISELPEGGLKFVISHHFEGNARSAGEQSHPARVKRIAQEAVTLSTSLPLSYSSSVFVRYDTSRLDVMKVLITGPSDTPYANGCFELDVFFPPDYPLSPMMINLETTGHHTIRFNPNLYNDGKVCLSVLNTWHGRPEEKWNAQTSSFLQVLVSIQSLILVPEPYFNEPGYERSRGTQAGTQSSREYNANICQATVRWAMLEQILNPCLCFKDIIHAHFYLKRNEILAQVEEWIKDLENDINEKRLTRTTTKRSPAANIDGFKKVYQQLKEQLMKLKAPEGVEDEADGGDHHRHQVEQQHPMEDGGSSGVDQTSSVGSGTTTLGVAAAGGSEAANEIDTDIDMEKMVKEMCEFDST